MHLKANVGGFTFYVRDPLQVSVKASLNELSSIPLAFIRKP